MPKGDAADQLARLKAVLPPWFADERPIVNAVLAGVATASAFIFGLIAFAQLQTRIATATGGWLDLIAQDFFGASLLRHANQSDASFRNAIVINLFRERATRAGMVRVLTDLTGIAPDIFEPSRIQDTGGYGAPTLGYGVAGGYGSTQLPFQAFVIAYRPLSTGIPLVSGYGIPTGAYATSSRSDYASIESIVDYVTDAEIYAAVDAVKPVGTTIWVAIRNGAPVRGAAPDYSLLFGGGIVLFNDQVIRLVGWSG